MHRLLAVFLLCGLVSAVPLKSTIPCFDELRDIAVTPQTDPNLWNVSHRVNNPDWNGQSTVEPSFVAVPQSAEDVQRCLLCATLNGLRVSVKGGGHSFGGYGTIPASEGFMINMEKLNHVSPVTKIVAAPGEKSDGTAHVRAQAGARWMDVYQSFRASGENWVVTGGLCPSVGIVGFTLGGGTGPSARLHGLAVDSVVNFTVVTPTGDAILSVNDQENTDLFWALRGGGGGNFGVVVDMTLKVYPGPDRYSWGTVCFAWSDTEAVMSALHVHRDDLPRTVNVDVIMGPDQGACLWIITMETLNTTRAALSPIYQTAAEKKREMSGAAPASSPVSPLEPISDNLQETNCWWEMIAAFAKAHGYAEYDDEPFYSKNCFIDAISDDLIRAMKNLSESTLPADCDNGHHFIRFGGKVREVSPSATAFAWRNTEFMVYTSCGYTEGSDTAKQEATDYLNKWWDTISPFCNGGSYVNFIDPLARQGADRRYFGSNADRLREIKSRWNPPGFGPLHFPMEIGGAGDE